MSNSNSLKFAAAISIVASAVTLVGSTTAANATDTQRLRAQSSHVHSEAAANRLEALESQSKPAQSNSVGKSSKTQNAVIGNLKG